MFWQLIVSLLSIAVAPTLQDSVTCSTACKIDDASFDCWRATENYAVQQIVSAVNNLTGVEIMIERWRVKNGVPAESVKKAVDDILQRMDQFGMIEGGPLNSTSLTQIMRVTLYEVLSYTMNRTFGETEYLYDYSCPIPCDYYNLMWMYLFICVSVILILTLIYMAIYVLCKRSQMRKRLL